MSYTHFFKISYKFSHFDVISLGCHWHQWVLLSFQVYAYPVCPAVCPEWRYCSDSFKDFRYQPETWWDDAQYHEADGYKKWPCSANFCAFHGALKFSMIGLDQVWGMTLLFLTLNGFQLSAWNLMGRSTVKWSKSLLKMAVLRLVLRVIQNFKYRNFKWQAWTRSEGIWLPLWMWGNHIIARNLVAWCNVPWIWSLF